MQTLQGRLSRRAKLAFALASLIVCGLFVLNLSSMSPAQTDALPAWLYGARIVTPYDYPDEQWTSWEEAVDRAVADGANVILDWSCASDDWRCLFEPQLSRDVQEIRRRAQYVHGRYPGVKYLLYVAPLEYVTPDVDRDGDGRVDPGRERESLARQHPEWLQMGISGRRAVFYGSEPGMPFWVCESCEDVWLTPAHPEYRRLALKQAQRLATSGIDGLWLDVPFLRHSFGERWRAEWPDVGPNARRLFQEQTGFSLPEPPLVPDWSDPAWLHFVKWRYQLIREFVSEYRSAIKAVNPSVELIIESSTGFNAHMTQTAASPIELPRVSTLMAHEWGPTRRPVQYYTWLSFLAGLLAWKHVDVAAGKPSWLLSYVEAGYPDTAAVARLHAATAVLAGFGYYTSGNETMSGIPDIAFRRELFAWLRDHRDVLFDSTLRPYANVAVVFSQQTLDFRGRGSWELGAYADGFLGILMLLLESHIPFEVLTEQDLDLERLGEFEAVIAPSWEAMSEVQADTLRRYVEGGGVLIATGETSRYDEWGLPREDFALQDLFGVHAWEVAGEDERVFVREVGQGRVIFAPIPHEQWYFWAAQPWDPSAANYEEAEAERLTFLESIWAEAGVEPVLSTTAPPAVFLIPWLDARGNVQVRVLNYTGIDEGKAVPQSQTLRLSLRPPFEENQAPLTARWLDFLGSWQDASLDDVRVSLGGLLQLEWEPQ